MDVIVVGSSNVDLISYVTRLPKPGETLLARKFEVGFGGKGSNQCIAASLLGARTGMITKLGDDAFGRDFMENYKTNNISTDYITVTKESSTGAASIAVDELGQNSIIVAAGANDCLSLKDINDAEKLIQQAKVLTCQFEIDLEVTLEALKLAKKHNVTTILNPAPAQADINGDLYKYSDFFVPNETEAELLTGISVTDVKQAEKAVNVLWDKGCKNVIITLGESGCLYGCQENRTCLHIPARKTNVVDSTGAGDAYVGALAYYLACHESLDMETKLKRACEIATVSVQSPGTQKSYAKRGDLPPELFS